jgi:hypothetical protein
MKWCNQTAGGNAMSEIVITGAVQTWLASFPVQEAKANLDALETEQAKLEVSIAALRRLIETVDGKIAAPVTTKGNGTNGHNPSGMDAVERVMRDRPGVWTRRDLNRELVERHWLAEGEPGRKTLGSILYRMVKADRIVPAGRVGEGRYKLPESEQEVQAA